ncbi:hypothetical protein [Flaviaesturariibacter amylovorans]|uniref:DUF1376 domain-containing protein n=1 Tax=Flaviaesturariibacter amylovorans TaxID=1084520 RepID=A0ABP8GQ76_9BACT
MARIRTIKPQFFFNEELAELPAMARLLFIGLWTQADREGRLLDRPKRLKAEIFPFENYDMDKGLDALQRAGFILRYKVDVNADGRVSTPEQPVKELAVIQILTFTEHQKIDKTNEKPSEIPPPRTLDYESTNDSLVKVGEGKGREQERKGGEPPASPPPSSDQGQQKKGVLVPPPVQEVEAFFEEKGYSKAAARKAHEYYSTAGWKDSRGNPVKNWKQKMIAVWFKPENLNTAAGTLPFGGDRADDYLAARQRDLDAFNRKHGQA